MRILVVCYEHPPVGGGGGRIASAVASGLADMGSEVLFLTGGMRGLSGTETIGRMSLIRIPSPRKKADTCSILEMAWFVFFGILPGIYWMKKFRPDVVHAHFAVPSGALAWFLCFCFRTPLVITAHLGDVPGGVPEQTGGLFRIVKPFTIPIWKGAAVTTAVSSFVAGLALSAYGIRPEVIPNGVDFSDSAPAKSHRPLKFLFVGRISIQKNLLLALEALRNLVQWEWTFEVVGDGPLRAQAEEFCRTNALDGRVHFHGWLSPQELAAVRQNCEVLLIPSRQEGLPMAAIESLVAGHAIVGTKIDGLVDVVDPGRNGLLVDADPASFASAIQSLLSDSARLESMKAESAKKAGDFRMERILALYDQALRRAVSHCPAAPFSLGHS